MLTKWVVILWVVGCMAGILVMSVNQLADFDPDSKLSLAMGDMSFEDNLLSQLQKEHRVTNNALVHFTQDNCFCDTLSQPHIQNFSDSLQNQGFENIVINLNQYPEFAEFIPSIPAVAIVGKLQELIYLGPYSKGYSCLQGVGLVDALIPNIINETIENTLFITDTKGCYCPT
jgi:hypothetical protein